jgi:hypothetical protein
MPKSKSPSKKYTPRPVRPPITKGLFDQLGQDLHFALMAFEHGGITVGTWKRIAKVLTTVSFATDNDARIDRADKVAIDSAVLTVRCMSDREVRTGQWVTNDMDLIALRRGVTAAERVIPVLDYRKLVRGYTQLAAMIDAVKTSND